MKWQGKFNLKLGSTAKIFLINGGNLTVINNGLGRDAMTM